MKSSARHQVRFATGLFVFVGLVALTGCGFTSIGDGLPDDIDCTSCHGSEGNPAPPVSVSGTDETSTLGVGAHRAHLDDGEFRRAVSCNECHVVPRGVDDEGHVDPLPAELTWGGLATANGSAPVWDRDDAVCSNVYCHGATLSGGSNTEPVWTRVGEGQADCGTCHGNPPPAPHPDFDECNLCHEGTVEADGSINLEGGLHINGNVDVPGLTCGSCHGSGENAAPPVSLSGSSETSDIGVGAHQSHVRDGKLRKAVACTECHVLPDQVNSDGHIDPPPAEVRFGPLAGTGGLEPEWDRGSEACSNTWCHGASLAGGGNKAPVWTEVGTGQTACGTCHGSPPPAPHPQVDECHSCHSGTVRVDGSIDVAAGRHIDGVKDVPSGTCSACHGNQENAAPPVSLSGSFDTGDIEVGAHQSHLKDGTLRKAVACDECHVVPVSLEDDGHMDGSPAEVVFGDLASTGGLEGEWNRDSGVCGNVYCHGASLAGGGITQPIWNLVGAGQAACGTCHGFPPPQPHPALDQCWLCHPGTVKANGEIDVAGGLHINGVKDVPGGACNDCHGSDANPAPPKSLSGSFNTADTEVGAHQAHLNDGQFSKAMACSECHEIPDTLLAAGHMDAAPAEVEFGVLATTGGLKPIWSRETNICTNVYCHGASLTGGSLTNPDWTKAGQGQVNCGTCHGMPPAS
ncbi:MAG: CxxxxCH/CxxCH domain-containing protein, partial [Deltaproteobacteria bacterium]|nr:CxxxxCH/CxxCH domain-containing protein [Deltaproteobacteria bacterium]